MKKLSIILLALAFAVSFAGTAMAYHDGDEGTSEGALGISGKYTFDAENYSGQGDIQRQWYDDDLELVFRVNMGTVTGVVDFEISDDEDFDGNLADSSAGSTAIDPDAEVTYIDNYWVEWNTPVDGLKVKIGEYALTFARAVVIYADPAAHHIGFMYGLEGVDLGFYIGKIDETKTDDDDDNDALTLTANVTAVEFFKKLNFIYVMGSDKVGGADDSYGYLGVDTLFEVGPVDLALEYGSVTDDVSANETSFTYFQVNLDRLTGYGLNVEVFNSSDDGDLEGRFGGGDYYPLMIYGFRGGFGDLNDLQLIMVGGSYSISDNTTFKGKVLVTSEEGSSGEDVGTEFDLHLVHKFDDNVTGTFTYASWSPGDGAIVDGDTETDMRARFSFKF